MCVAPLCKCYVCVFECVCVFVCMGTNVCVHVYVRMCELDLCEVVMIGSFHADEA